MKAKTKKDLTHFRERWNLFEHFKLSPDSWILIASFVRHDGYDKLWLNCMSEYGGCWLAYGDDSPFCEFDEELERELIIYEMR